MGITERASGIRRIHVLLGRPSLKKLKAESNMLLNVQMLVQLKGESSIYLTNRTDSVEELALQYPLVDRLTVSICV